MASVSELAETVAAAREAGCQDLILLKCTSTYPSTPENTNLMTIPHLRELFNCEVGLSDHTLGIGVSVASVALGATVIEKHFTLDRNLLGPDHKASSLPEEFAELVKNVRRVEGMLGSPRKTCQAEERQMAEVSRKSLVLARSLRAGEILKPGDLNLMRPGTGIPASFIPRLQGLRVKNDLNALHQLRWNDLEGF
jgi:N-acetylneuraminate synthase